MKLVICPSGSDLDNLQVFLVATHCDVQLEQGDAGKAISAVY